MNRIARIAGHVQSSAQDMGLGAQPTAGYCAAAKGEDDVVICCAVRTPLCKAKRGSFKDTAPELLLAAVFKEVVARTKVNPKDIGDIQIGNVLQPGASGLTSRMGQFIAELPYEIPLSTVNRQCSSSLQATAAIAAFIKSGIIDVGLAGGVENMSMFPMMATIDITKLSKDVLDYPDAEACLLPMGLTSENVAAAYGIPRDRQDIMGDDMPPLEYVGADACLGISLREGDSVILKGLSKTALNGQTGTLQSFQKASKGRLPVKLDKSGSMLAVKPENIEKINTKVGGIPNHAVASAKATHVDRNASPPPPDDDDDELPPLEYVGEITNGTAEHGTGQMSDADDMPSLEYFGASKPSGPNHSKDSQPSVSKPSPPYAEARATGAPKEVPAATEKVLPETPVSTFRPGDQVLIKGTTKQLNGQQGIIESIKDGTCFVRLDKNKDVLQLGEANLHKIWLRGSGAGAMPPLQMVGQANGSAPLYSAPNGQNGTTEVERIKAPAESKAPRSSQGNRQETQDALQKMRSALHATASHEVDDALRLAETPGMAWGEWETEKTQILKQLRTKRSQIVEVRPQESQEVSRTVKKSTIETWCEELQLPQELLARLNEEDVTDPEELTGVGETELAALTSGLKIGPKGRFMKAVKRMKALEAAELGSAVSLS